MQGFPVGGPGIIGLLVQGRPLGQLQGPKVRQVLLQPQLPGQLGTGQRAGTHAIGPLGLGIVPGLLEGIHIGGIQCSIRLALLGGLLGIEFGQGFLILRLLLGLFGLVAGIVDLIDSLLVAQDLRQGL